MGQRLDADKIRENTDEKADVILLDETDSTNAEIRRRLKDGAADKTVVIARHQTAGRGRMGRSFFSSKDNGIYMSILLRSGIDEPVFVTTAVSVAVCRAIERVTGISPQIKWVNDLYLDGRKICGILCEAVSDFESGKRAGIIIGVGINCDSIEFPDELSQIAGSLGGVDKNRLAAELICGICKINELIADKSFLEEYRSRSAVLGREIVILGELSKNAVVTDIDEYGGLVVKLTNGEEKTLRSGEISIRVIE